MTKEYKYKRWLVAISMLRCIVRILFQDVENKICITKKIFLLYKESDYQQFHQYQQNEQLLLILTH